MNQLSYLNAAIARLKPCFNQSQSPPCEHVLLFNREIKTKGVTRPLGLRLKIKAGESVITQQSLST